MDFVYLKDQRKKILDYASFTERFACGIQHKHDNTDTRECSHCDDINKITVDVIDILEVIGANWCDYCGKNCLKEDLNFDEWENYWCKDSINCTKGK